MLLALEVDPTTLSTMLSLGVIDLRVHTNTGNPPRTLLLEDASLQPLDAETLNFYTYCMDT